MILTPDNVWIIGITQVPSMGGYYLVFYRETRPILHKVIQYHSPRYVKYIPFDSFYELKEIGSGGYRTVYTAKRENHSVIVVLKRFKYFDKALELFINEVSNL